MSGSKKDDELFPDTVANYKRACDHSLSDFVTAQTEVDGRICGVRGLRWAWLYGQGAYISGHAVGVAIKRDLHERFGFYSRMFPIAADQLFILKSIRGGASVSEQDFIAGRFNKLGTSGQDLIGSFVEGFRVNLSVGFGFWTQLVLVVLRLVKYKILQSFKR